VGPPPQLIEIKLTSNTIATEIRHAFLTFFLLFVCRLLGRDFVPSFSSLHGKLHPYVCRAKHGGNRSLFQ
jgi:hypothetical protein